MVGSVGIQCACGGVLRPDRHHLRRYCCLGGNRPGADFSYTNNFPHDPDVGNRPMKGVNTHDADQS